MASLRLCAYIASVYYARFIYQMCVVELIRFRLGLICMLVHRFVYLFVSFFVCLFVRLTYFL
jgi:hypothetical protein